MENEGGEILGTVAGVANVAIMKHAQMLVRESCSNSNTFKLLKQAPFLSDNPHHSQRSVSECSRLEVHNCA